MHTESDAPLVIGIDVGGTFTDVVCSDGRSTWRAKAPTEPAEFARGVIEGCGKIAAQLGISLPDLLAKVSRFGLGTTAVTNVLATQRGLKVGLITTAGFEGHLHLARGYRIEIEGWLEPPWIPVEETCVVGVNERVDRHGTILIGVKDDDVSRAVRFLVKETGVEAIAISFLWSFRNPKHERRVAEYVKRLYPNLPVFLGSELHPVLREYERTSVAVLNAFCAHALDGVDALDEKLRASGLNCPLLILHANGGTTTIAEARRQPISLAGSGPAAGAIASTELVKAMQLENALCCDMGGTSTDVALVRGAEPVRRQRGEVNGVFTAHTSIDVDSIGAGGGSIAWVDSRGLLRVGPNSARARPGPVCYRRGGTQPTVTDAMLVLGYIDEQNFLGGAMKLDREAARAACGELGVALGMSDIEVAWGIREIAVAEMAKAVRSRLALAGLDPRTLPIIAYGGSGSLFTSELAKQIGLPMVITPELASVYSAYGASTADVRREVVRTIESLFPLEEDAFDELRAELERLAYDEVARNGITPENRRVRLEADIHFERQKWELTIPVAAGPLKQEQLLGDFKSLFETRFGSRGAVADTAIELIALRAIGEGQTLKASLSAIGEGQQREIKSNNQRLVWIEPSQPQSIDVYHLDDLTPGEWLRGPALLDGRDTTIWIPARSECRMDERRALVTHLL